MDVIYEGTHFSKASATKVLYNQYPSKTTEGQILAPTFYDYQSQNIWVQRNKQTKPKTTCSYKPKVHKYYNTEHVQLATCSFTAAQDHMQHSPSVQCSEAVQQHPHTLVLAVAAVSCGLLSESSTSGS